MQAGANRFLPGHLPNIAVPAREERRDLPNAGLEFLSRMLGAFSLNGRVDSWTAQVAAEAARHGEVYKAIRHLLVQDFYPLTRQPTSESDWDAVQYVSHDGTESAVFAFRMAGDESEKRLRLKGLRGGAGYEVKELLEDGAPVVVPPGALQETGLPVVLARDQGRLFHLREAE